MEWTGKKIYWLEEGDSGTEGSSAIVDERKAAISLMPDVDGTEGSSAIGYGEQAAIFSNNFY